MGTQSWDSKDHSREKTGPGKSGVVDCLGCGVVSGLLLPPGGSFLVGDFWEFHVRMGGGRPAFILQPVNHVEHFSDLGFKESVEFALLLPVVMSAIVEVVGACRVYFGYFNETFPHHCHVHVWPRMFDDDVSLLGPLLDGAPAPASLPELSLVVSDVVDVVRLTL